MKFKTKAGMLEYLGKKVKKSKILPQVKFTVDDWKKQKSTILDKIKTFFKTDHIIIRSSSLKEDSSEESKAGQFESVLDINPKDTTKLKKSIEKVIASFDDKNKKNEIFIQKYLNKVKISGVIFTRDLITLAPYYIINFDDTSSKTDTVTSGKSNKLKTLVKYRKYKTNNKNFKNLFLAIAEIEKILHSDCLDLEFAIGSNLDIYILQVRPIVTKNKKRFSSDEEIEDYLKRAYKKIQKLSKRHAYLFGNTTFFGVMPDWNPAEMIGTKPRRLAESLYKELITDRIWAYQRDNYGYKNLRSFPLMKTFLGTPFIDVRVDFNSFIPEDLSNTISEKLVSYYLRKLAGKPTLHDKIEFEIVFSCYYINLPRRLSILKKEGFTTKEIMEVEDSLLKLTNKTFFENKSHKKDLEKIEELKNRFEKIKNSDMHTVDKIYWLTEYCKRYGTLPFAGIARSAFVATQFLNSFLEEGIISNNGYKNFLGSISTVAKDMSRDFYNFKTGKLSKFKFLEKYGHLRPGTYDITSKRYDENFEKYFSNNKQGKIENLIKFKINKTQIKKINKILSNHGIKTSAEDIFNFVIESIEGREYGKYVFTKTLSQILVFIEDLGKECNISREDLSYLNIQIILDLYSSLDHRGLHEILSTDIETNKKYHNKILAIKFPHLISNPKDVYEFYLSEEEPNFVTLKRVRAETLLEKDANNNLNNKILFIESADPGYDWIFSHEIAGFITKYGGANSHMAIRAAESNIPAVVGCGKINFDNWSKAKNIEIDCSNRQVKVLQ